MQEVINEINTIDNELKDDKNLKFLTAEKEESRDKTIDLGTFKNVQSLKDAYEHLRSSFTQKSMELAKLKKESDKVNVTPDENNINNESDKVNTTPDEKTDYVEVSKVDADESKALDKAVAPEKQNDNEIIEPSKECWNNQNWDNDVASFFETNPNAQSYAKDIAKVLIQDDKIAKSKNPLYNAWIKILQNDISVDKLLENSELLQEKILNNPIIKNQIIEEYIATIQKNNALPPMIAKQEMGGVGSIVGKKPTSMTQAKELAKKLFR